MSQLTAADLNYLRNEHPHRVRVYLSVLDPDVVYCGTVAAVPADNYHVEVVNVSGNLANVVEGQAIVVGTSCGDDSIARRRYKERVGQVLEIDESDVDWQIGDYVTVLDTWDLRPKFPYTLIETPWTFYKDRDIVYGNQNEFPDPVAIAGSHQAGFLTGGSVTFNLPMNGLDESYVIADGAAIVSHLWVCDGGAIANPNVAVTTITFTVAGQYWVSLTVTDDNVKTHTTRRIIFVHDRPDTGDYEPITAFSLQGPLVGDWRQGGWNTSIQVREDITESEFPPGTFVLIWYELFYDDTEVYFGDSGNIALAGYVSKESITKEVATGYVNFEVKTIHGLMKNIPLYSVSLEYVVAPSEWYEYANLTLARALHHYFYEHSTLLEVTDVFLPTTTLLMPACDDLAEGDMYAQADSVAFMHSIFAHLCCDKMGRLHIEVDLNMRSVADRNAATTVMTILDNDRRGDLGVVRNPYNRVPLISASGISFDGVTTTPYLSNAPGTVMLTEGANPVAFERLLVADQDDLNYKAGRLLAIANTDIMELRLNFAGNYFPALDIVPQEWFLLTTDETKRGLPLTDRYICRTVSADINIVTGTIFPNIVLEPEVESVDGVTEGIPPDDPPTDPPDPGPPPIGPPLWPPIDHLMTGALVAFDASEGCWYRAPLAADWVERDAGLPPGAVDDDVQGGWDPWWFTEYKQNTVDPAYAILFRCQVGHIYRSTNCGVTWTEVTPTDDPPDDWADVPAPTVDDVTFVQRVDNIHVNKQHIFLVEWQNGLSEWRSWFLKTEDDGNTWSWLSLAADCPLSASWTFGSALEGWVTYKVEGTDADGVTLTWDPIEDATGDGGGSALLDVPDQGVSRLWARYIYKPTEEMYVTTALTVMSGTHKRTGNIDNLTYWRIYFDDGSWWSFNLGAIPPLNWGTRADTIAGGDAGKIINRIYLNYHCDLAEVWLDDFELTGLTIQDQVRVLWADLDSEDGTILWVTLWIDGMLYLHKRSVSNLGLLASYNMGAASQAEMEAKTYIAYPVTPLGDKDYCVIYGRMDNPQALGGIQHVIETTDGGTIFSSMESGWGADICSALHVSADDGAGNRMYTAIKDASAGVPAHLYRGVNGVLAFISALSFGTNRGVLVDAITLVVLDGVESIACGADAAGAIMVAYILDPFTTWVDITNSYPATGVVRSLTYL